MSANHYKTTPEQQETLVEIMKQTQKLKDMTPSLIECLKEEQFECEFDLFYLRRSELRRILDWFRGIPWWSPNGDYYKWAKKNHPELISQFRNKGDKNGKMDD